MTSSPVRAPPHHFDLRVAYLRMIYSPFIGSAAGCTHHPRSEYTKTAEVSLLRTLHGGIKLLHTGCRLFFFTPQLGTMTHVEKPWPKIKELFSTFAEACGTSRDGRRKELLPRDRKSCICSQVPWSLAHTARRTVLQPNAARSLRLPESTESSYFRVKGFST